MGQIEAGVATKIEAEEGELAEDEGEEKEEATSADVEEAEPTPEESDALLAEIEGEIERARQEIEEERANPIRAVARLDFHESTISLMDATEIVAGRRLACAGPPLDWRARARDLHPHEIDEIVLCMQRFAILFINSASHLLLIPDSRIEQIREGIEARREAEYNKVVAWEWFFGPYYGGRKPRIALEDVSPVISIHPDWLRWRMRHEPPAEIGVPREKWALPPELRAELYSRGTLRPTRFKLPQEERDELGRNRGDPELATLEESAPTVARLRAKPTRMLPAAASRIVRAANRLLHLSDVPINPVTRLIVEKSDAVTSVRQRSEDATTAAFQVVANFGSDGIDLLSRARSAVR